MTKEIRYGGLRIGKSEMARRAAEVALDAGKTVAFISSDGVEVRGAGAAKDITPKPAPASRQIEKK